MEYVAVKDVLIMTSSCAVYIHVSLLLMLIYKTFHFSECELGRNCIQLVYTGVKCWMRCLEEDGFAAGIFDRDGLE